jgi:hypothetical protein
MGCKNSSQINPVPTNLTDTQPPQVKKKILIATKRDDPLLLNKIIKESQFSFQEKIIDGFDTNWTIMHLAASKNAYKVIEEILREVFKYFDSLFDLVNSRDASGKTPLQVAYDYSSLEAFEVILTICSRFNHPLVIDKLFEKSLTKGNPFEILLAGYKYGDTNFKRDKNQSNITKEDEKYELRVNKGSLDNYTKLKEKYLKAEGQFKDKEFSHTSKSVFQNAPNESFSSTKSTAFQVKWNTLDKIFAENKYDIFSNLEWNSDASANSINPLLNFVYALISLHPNILNSIFLENKPNEKGYFAATLFKNSLPTVMFLDEWFPFFKKKEELMFQRPFGNEIWPMLIEKGLAKLYGGYSALANLSIEELIESVIGAPVTFLEINPSFGDIFWIKLQDEDKKNHLMLAKFRGQRSYMVIESVHDFSKKIIKVKKVSKEIQAKKYFSEILIDDEMRKIVGYETKENGIYYYSLEDFLEEFDTILCCNVSSLWNNSSVWIKQLTDSVETFEFTLKRPGTVYLSFY